MRWPYTWLFLGATLGFVLFGLLLSESLFHDFSKVGPTILLIASGVCLFGCLGWLGGLSAHSVVASTVWLLGGRSDSVRRTNFLLFLMTLLIVSVLPYVTYLLLLKTGVGIPNFVLSSCYLFLGLAWIYIMYLWAKVFVVPTAIRVAVILVAIPLLAITRLGPSILGYSLAEFAAAPSLISVLGGEGQSAKTAHAAEIVNVDEQNPQNVLEFRRVEEQQPTKSSKKKTSNKRPTKEKVLKNSQAFDLFLVKRDAIEKAVSSFPELLDDDAVFPLYKRIWRTTYRIRANRIKKSSGAPKWVKEKVVLRKAEMLVFKSTKSQVDDLFTLLLKRGLTEQIEQ